MGDLVSVSRRSRRKASEIKTGPVPCRVGAIVVGTDSLSPSVRTRDKPFYVQGMLSRPSQEPPPLIIL